MEKMKSYPSCLVTIQKHHKRLIQHIIKESIKVLLQVKVQPMIVIRKREEGLKESKRERERERDEK